MNWIKMRHCVYTAPEVVRISSALQTDRLRTVGALFVLWCIADMHADDDGLLPNYTENAVDDAVGWPGFASAVVSSGWLCTESNGLRIPNFQRHNGQNARRRALDASRKKVVRKTSASKTDKKRTREEKRRVNPLTPLPGFDRFWEAWPKHPRKKARPQCREKWVAHDLELVADKIILSVEEHKRSYDWTKKDGEYVPGPLVWLNQSGWEATPKPAKAADTCPDPEHRDDWWKDEDGTWVRKDTAEYGVRLAAWDRRRRMRLNGATG